MPGVFLNAWPWLFRAVSYTASRAPSFRLSSQPESLGSFLSASLVALKPLSFLLGASQDLPLEASYPSFSFLPATLALGRPLPAGLPTHWPALLAAPPGSGPAISGPGSLAALWPGTAVAAELLWRRSSQKQWIVRSSCCSYPLCFPLERETERLSCPLNWFSVGKSSDIGHQG